LAKDILLNKTRTQSYDFRIYNYNPSAVVCRLEKNIDREKYSLLYEKLAMRLVEL
jgi:hypothetical protein